MPDTDPWDCSLPSGLWQACMFTLEWYDRELMAWSFIGNLWFQSHDILHALEFSISIHDFSFCTEIMKCNLWLSGQKKMNLISQSLLMASFFLNENLWNIIYLCIGRNMEWVTSLTRELKLLISIKPIGLAMEAMTLLGHSNYIEACQWADSGLTCISREQEAT